jgi:CsoR family transcriptional regulator, copper-sensing transcriptional repressor
MRQDIKTKALRRLKIAEGQVRGIQKMIEEESYCVDIITQTEAIKEALTSVGALLLENHLSTHVASQMKESARDKMLSEIMKVYKLALKNK